MESNTLTFDLGRTLQVVTNDKDLSAILAKRFPNEDATKLVAKAKAGKVGADVEEFAKEVFEHIIPKRASLLEFYERQLPTKAKTASLTSTAQPEKKEGKTKLPKEYGKKRVEEDIKANGGVATEFHNTMLALNSVKNIWMRLNAMGTRNRYGNGRAFTPAECKEILAVEKIMKQRLAKIK